MATHDFPPFPSEHVVKGPQLIHAFLRDYISHKLYLLRENAALRSEIALAIDYQQQACKTIQRTEGKLNNHSFVVAEDGGIILSYVIVPSTHGKWLQPCMEEVVKRHGPNLPGTCYVD